MFSDFLCILRVLIPSNQFQIVITEFFAKILTLAIACAADPVIPLRLDCGEPLEVSKGHLVDEVRVGVCFVRGFVVGDVVGVHARILWAILACQLRTC